MQTQEQHEQCDSIMFLGSKVMHAMSCMRACTNYNRWLFITKTSPDMIDFQCKISFMWQHKGCGISGYI